jgi:hypothetical protein
MLILDKALAQELAHRLQNDWALQIQTRYRIDPAGAERIWSVVPVSFYGSTISGWVVTCATSTRFCRLDEVDIETTRWELEARAMMACGLAYDSDATAEILYGDDADWAQYYPEMDDMGALTGDIVDADSGNYIVVGDIAMIHVDNYQTFLAQAEEALNVSAD